MNDCPSMATIQKRVAERFEVCVMDIRSARRDRPTVQARHAAMYLCRELTHFSLPEIGRQFGKRDHTTVMYALQKVADQKRLSPEFAQALSGLAEELVTDLREEVETVETAAPEMLQGSARDAALAQLTPMLQRREALAAELKLLNHQIDEIGRRVWGAGEGSEEAT